MTTMKTKTTTPFLAVLAGLTAIKGVQRTEEAIEKAVPKFLAAGGKIAKPSDGTVTTGRFTGLHVMKFQDMLYGHNMLKGWGFTDAELAVAWRGEFPTAKCNFANKNAYVTSARADLNRGKRGMSAAQLNAQFGFEGPVTQFYAKPVEVVKVKRAKKEKAQPTEPAEVVPETVSETLEPVAE